MATITVSLPSDGDTIDVVDYNTPITTIVNEFNGGISNDNISATAGISGTKLGAGTSGVGNDNLNTTAGDVGGSWLAWTPTFTGFTKGSATIVSRYTKIGKTVHFFMSITLAANSSLDGSSIVFTIPQNSTSTSEFASSVRLVDASGSTYNGICYLASTTTAIILNLKSDGTYVTHAALGGSAPFTWTTSDSIRVSGTYEIA